MSNLWTVVGYLQMDYKSVLVVILLGVRRPKWTVRIAKPLELIIMSSILSEYISIYEQIGFNSERMLLIVRMLHRIIFESYR